jgi:serine/threonine protein kinase
MSGKYVFRGNAVKSPTTASIRRDKTTRSINDFINSGITSGPGISVTPSSKLLKKEDIPPQYHRILQESAGHCRSHQESACVRKLLEAVRISHNDEVNEQSLKTTQETEAESNHLNLDHPNIDKTDMNETKPAQMAALERLYTDSPSGLAAPPKDDGGDGDDEESLMELPSQIMFDSPQKTVRSEQSFPESEQSEDSSLQPLTGKFALLLRNEIANAASKDFLMTGESPKPLREKTSPTEKTGEDHSLAEKANEEGTKNSEQPVSSSPPKEEKAIPQRPPHPLFAPNALALSRTKLKKVSFTEIQDTSGPKLKSSLAQEADFPEDVLVAKLRGALDAWLSEEAKFFPLDASQFNSSCSEKTLGAGRFAKVVVAKLPPNSNFVGMTENRYKEPTLAALKISTFADSKEDSIPRGVLLSWEREMKTLIALSKLSFSDHLVEVRGGCLNPRPMIALELCDNGNLTQFMNQISNKNDNTDLSSEGVSSNASLRMSLVLDCCHGLSVMHKAGWCHLDLKPHNVMVTKSSAKNRLIAKIGDFGSCFQFTLLQRSYSAEGGKKKKEKESAWALLRAGVGTTGWTAPDLLAAVDIANEMHEEGATSPMSPNSGVEEASSLQSVHSSSDCFSFGILMWFCLFQDVAQMLPSSSTTTFDHSSPSSFTSASLLSANPLMGLNAEKCKAALIAGNTPPWPKQQQGSVSKVGDLLSRCLLLDRASRPDMETIGRELREAIVDCERWSS